MTQDAYITLQQANIDSAIELARNVLKISTHLHSVCDTADKKEEAKNQDAASAYIRDSLKYFDFNDAVSGLSGMMPALKDLKKKLIEIKIENDKMLMDGGYRDDIDIAIANVFKNGTLWNLKTIEKETLDTIKETISALESLKGKLS